MAEAEFVRRAVALGLTVCQPFNEGARFDFSVHSARAALRVQVKSCWGRRRDRHYTVNTAGHTGSGVTPYTAAEIDILAAYLGAEDLWYIIPMSAVPRGSRANLYPNVKGSRARFERFREAWHLLFEPACPGSCPSAAKAGEEMSVERHG